MDKIDLIINALENSEPTGTGWVHAHEQKHQAALAAARELRELKPVAYMDSRGILFNWTTHPHLNTALYALDEVKHD
jgi:N6-adenosine-specific RNA methylase IME4